jgi:hypothetical protein
VGSKVSSRAIHCARLEHRICGSEMFLQSVVDISAIPVETTLLCLLLIAGRFLNGMETFCPCTKL